MLRHNHVNTYFDRRFLVLISSFSKRIITIDNRIIDNFSKAELSEINYKDYLQDYQLFKTGHGISGPENSFILRKQNLKNRIVNL